MVLLLSGHVSKKYIKEFSNLKDMILELETGKLDLISYEELTINWMIKKSGKNISDYDIVFPLKKVDLYYAFNINTPDDLIKEIQLKLDEVKNTKDYKAILDSYFK